MVWRNIHGFPQASLWTLTSSLIFMTHPQMPGPSGAVPKGRGTVMSKKSGYV